MRSLTIALLFCIVTVLAAGSVSADLIAWTEHSTIKVRPFVEPPTGQDEALLYCAQNEWEAVQVIVRDHEGGGLTGCDLTVSPLEGPGENIETIDLYRESYVWIEHPSQKPMDTDKIGFWPDGMIPFTDVHFGEDRDGAPFDVEPWWNQAIWIDIYVPADQEPGEYAAEIEVTCDGQEPVSLPLTLTVWDFELPNNITLPSNYGYGCSTAYNKHTAMGGTPEREELTQLYYVEALRHRMMLSSGHCAGPQWNWDPGTETGWFDMTDFERNAGPVFDGTLYLPGASFNTYRMPYPPGSGSETEKVAFWRELAQEFKARGWFEKMYLYLPDEPTPEQYPRLVELSEMLHEADPDYRAMATEQIAEGLIGAVDIWCPDEPLFSDSLPFPPFPEDYPPRQELGETVWWYNCMSAQFIMDYSNHFVDQQGMYMRIWPWLTRRYNFEGILFWETVYLYRFGEQDPWIDQYSTKFFCNGDGTMFYPGVPDKIGGTRDIPCPSLKLKMLREGMEDYEYFAIADGMGYEDFVQAEVLKRASTSYQWEHDPLVIEQSRHKLAALILGEWDTQPPEAPSGILAESGEGSITLSWTANAEPDIAGYEVSLARYPGERIPAGTVADGSTQAVFDGLQVGKPYYLTVRAFDEYENVGPWGEEVSAVPEAPDDQADDDAGEDEDDGDDDDGCFG